MKVTNRQLEALTVVFSKLSNYPCFKDVKTSYNIFKITKQLQEEYGRLLDFRKSLEKEFFVYENDIPKRNTDGSLQIQEKKTKQEYLLTLDKLFDEPIKLETYDVTFTLEDFEDIIKDKVFVPSDFEVLELFLVN